MIKLRALLLPLFSICLTVVVITACESRKTPQEYIAQAQEHIAQNKLGAAQIELKNALQIDPRNAEARWRLGALYVRLGDGAAAEKELKQALALGVPLATVQPRLAQALLLQAEFPAVLELVPDAALTPQGRGKLLAARGSTLLAQKKPEAAEKEFAAALAADPKSVEAFTGRAGLAVARGDLPSAREALTEALGIDEHFAPAWRLLGMIEFHDGHNDAAEVAFTKAIDNSAGSLADLLNRTYVRLTAKNYDQVADDIRDMRKRFKGVPNIDYTEGLLLFQQEKYAEAASAFEKVVAVDDEFAPALYYAGTAQFMAGNRNQAEDYLSRYNFRRPNNPLVLKMLASINLQRGEFKDAEKLIQPVLKQDKDDEFAMNLLASALMGQNKTAEGVDYFKKIVGLKPDLAPAHINLGLGLVAAGDVDAGIEQLKKAKELNPESEDADIKIVLVYLNHDELDKALNAALAYRKERPKSISAHVLLGTVYMARGDSENAGKVFTEALQIEPGNVTANGGMAAIAVYAGKLDEAKRYYQDALEKHPDNLGTLMNLAKLENSQSDGKAMEATLQQAIKTNPQAPQPRVMLAQYYLQSGDANKALTVLAEVRAAQMNNPAYLSLLGDAELATGNTADALNDMNALTKLAPNNADAHFLLARAMAASKDINGYRAELEKSVALDKTHRSARIALARLFLQQGDTKDAAAHIKVLKQQAKGDQQILTLEGDLARATGDLDKAIGLYQQAYDSFGNNLNLLRLEDAQWTAGHRDAAVGLLQDWVKKYPEDALTALELASRYMALGRADDAIATYTKIVDYAPRNAVALNNLAMLTLPKDPKRAAEYAEKAYSLAPESADILDTLAVVLSKSDSKRSQRTIDQALEKAPDNPAFLYHKAMILRDAGQTSEALGVLQTLLADDRKFPERQDAEHLQTELRAGS